MKINSERIYDYETKKNGIYEYNWNASAHPSGLYFARLNFNETFHTQKLILMK